MRRDVHLAALKVATRLTTGVAFSVALMGCSSADPSSDDGQEASTADDLSNALKTSKKKKQGCHEDSGTTPAPSCKEVLDSAFPTPSNYPGTKTEITAEVESCCVQQLTDHSTLGGEHRWDCCANVSQKDNNIGMACTPWGPPVPPKMKRRMLALTMGVA